MTKVNRSASRDFLLARLAACRASVADASIALDACLSLFRTPEEDAKGKDRAALLEAIDEHLGEAASSVQLAQTAWPDIDVKEGEPEAGEEEEEEDEEEDE